MTSSPEKSPAKPESALTSETMKAAEHSAVADHAHTHDHSPWYLGKVGGTIFFAITAAIALIKWSEKAIEAIEKTAASGHIPSPKAGGGHGGGDHGGGHGGGGHH